MTIARQFGQVCGAVCLALAAGASWAQVGGIYTCTDANGRKLTSDRPIPACLDREQNVLNPQGREILYASAGGIVGGFVGGADLGRAGAELCRGGRWEFYERSLVLKGVERTFGVRG